MNVLIIKFGEVIASWSLQKVISDKDKVKIQHLVSNELEELGCPSEDYEIQFVETIACDDVNELIPVMLEFLNDSN